MSNCSVRNELAKEDGTVKSPIPAKRFNIPPGLPLRSAFSHQAIGDRAVDRLKTLDFTSWAPALDGKTASACTQALESGLVPLLPHLGFELAEDERYLLSPRWSDGKAKNISYDPSTTRVKHTSAQGADQEAIGRMMGRFAGCAKKLVDSLFPLYAESIRLGMTSYRPVEAAGRASSLKKDDTLLHVDSFVSRPTGGKRILRLFSNVNPEGRPREWVLGEEPFQALANRFLPKIPKPVPGSAWLLDVLGLTKGRRTPYDHYMLQLHDRGKLDSLYQETCPKLEVGLPAGSTWIVYTDLVSHAVKSGQYVLEQTFYLPVEAMQNPELSPLRTLERLLGAKLA